MVWALDACWVGSAAAVPVPVCSTLLTPPLSPTPSSRLQEARLLVSMGEPSNWLLTAVKASESSALSGDSEAVGTGSERLRGRVCSGDRREPEFFYTDSSKNMVRIKATNTTWLSTTFYKKQ